MEDQSMAAGNMQLQKVIHALHNYLKQTVVTKYLFKFFKNMQHRKTMWKNNNNHKPSLSVDHHVDFLLQFSQKMDK